jgi:hypothetical protein
MEEFKESGSKNNRSASSLPKDAAPSRFIWFRQAAKSDTRQGSKSSTAYWAAGW